jgi:hypothetical protein
MYFFDSLIGTPYLFTLGYGSFNSLDEMYFFDSYVENLAIFVLKKVSILLMRCISLILITGLVEVLKGLVVSILLMRCISLIQDS